MTENTIKSGIYRIHLGGENNRYIGSSYDLIRRQCAHLRDLKAGKHGNEWVQNCWDKYGVFKFEIIVFCPVEDLLELEQVLIKRHFGTPGCVNICPIAGNCAGRPVSEASRQKISDSHLLRPPVSDATRDKMSKSAKGKRKGPKTESHCKNLSISQLAWVAANPRTHCRRGHLYDATNTYCPPNGRRRCRECRKYRRSNATSQKRAQT